MTSIFARALGDAAFARLPAAVQRLHRGGSFQGEATIEAPATALARLAARLARFPPPGEAMPLRLDIHRDARGEAWTRHFGRHRMATRLHRAPEGQDIVERLGPFAVRMAPTGSAAGLDLAIRGWRSLGIPLPRCTAPGGHAWEGSDAAGRFTFDIAIDLPFGLGRVIRYRGWLVPVSA